MTDIGTKAPYARAAFINVICEEGTKADACHHLQETWNELCAARAQVRKLTAKLDAAREVLEWYADEVLAYSITQVSEPRSAVHADRGARARSALDAWSA